MDSTDHELEIDAAKEETSSALRHLVLALQGKRPDDTAWWLCANHARFIIDHQNLTSEAEMIAMAERAGPPPKGENWQAWFDRVRSLPSHQ